MRLGKVRVVAVNGVSVVRVIAPAEGGLDNYALVCPYCGHSSTFTPIKSVKDLQVRDRGGSPVRINLGHRMCGNPECEEHVFTVERQGNVATYPPVHIPFDRTGLPERVTRTFQEVITCHAYQCYIAAGIMLRKTLEEVCADRGATAKNLELRIEKLGETVVLPQGFVQAMHSLRYLGNDAAHIDARTYEAIGREEIEVGIEVTKLLLQSLYQFDSVIARLEALKRQQDADAT